MLVAEMVASCLVAREFPNVFPKSSPSAIDFPECIVLAQGAFERESRIEGEERGRVAVACYVVRDACGDAEAVANAAEGAVRGCGWERFGERWPWRVVGVDTTAPRMIERDSSGRYVWEFDIDVTVVRSVG